MARPGRTVKRETLRNPFKPLDSLSPLPALFLQLLDRPLDFTGFGEPFDLMLGEDQAAIDVHVEHPTLPTDKLGLDAELLFQRRGQTGRARQVVSRHTPRNRNVHRDSSLYRHYRNGAAYRQAGSATGTRRAPTRAALRDNSLTPAACGFHPRRVGAAPDRAPSIRTKFCMCQPCRTTPQEPRVKPWVEPWADGEPPFQG